MLIYLSTNLDQKTAKGPFRSSSQVATCLLLDNSTIEASL